MHLIALVDLEHQRRLMPNSPPNKSKPPWFRYLKKDEQWLWAMYPENKPIRRVLRRLAKERMKNDFLQEC